MTPILIIDDNTEHRLIYRIWLEGVGFQVIEAATAAEGFEKASRERPSCVLMDYFIGGENGLVLLQHMRRDIADCPPIIMLSCALTEALERNSLASGACGCFDKSKLDREVLFTTIENAIRSRA